jgi:hypothetical protein
MNQSQGHLLLSNILIIAINLTQTLEAEIRASTNVVDALDDFDVKVLIFQDNMQSKVLKVIKPFLQFLQAYDGH